MAQPAKVDLSEKWEIYGIFKHKRCSITGEYIFQVDWKSTEYKPSDDYWLERTGGQIVTIYKNNSVFVNWNKSYIYEYNFVSKAAKELLQEYKDMAGLL